MPNKSDSVPEQLSARVRSLVAEHGFTVAGIARAIPLTSARESALDGLHEGRFAAMRWMTEDWVQRSTNPDAFLEGCRSFVVVGLVTGPEPEIERQDSVRRGRVARYAWGRDYHRVFEPRLKALAADMSADVGGQTRTTVDYGPLLERPVAAAAGLGWIGKSTMLLVPGIGPWLLLAVIATTIELRPDAPSHKSCGACTRCVGACPTGALGAEGGVLDARLCISYQTIENRGPIPRDLRPLMGDWVFGCDACLTSCPVGRSPWTSEPELSGEDINDRAPSLTELIALDDRGFEKRYKGRALMRAKRDGLARNACVALGNTGHAGDLPCLLRALGDPSGLVRGHAAWAVARLVERGAIEPANAAACLTGALARESDPDARQELEYAIQAISRPALPDTASAPRPAPLP